MVEWTMQPVNYGFIAGPMVEDFFFFWVGEPVGLLLEYCCRLASFQVMGQGGHQGSWVFGRGSGFDVECGEHTQGLHQFL